jgi:hypothetical protein
MIEAEAMALLDRALKRGDGRAKMLLDAASCILRDRNRVYGEPEDNFRRIAEFWNVWLRERGLLRTGCAVDLIDVAVMQGLVKTARMIETPTHRDSHVDCVGYAAIAGALCESSLPSGSSGP